MPARILQFPAAERGQDHENHETCPKCGARNGPFERLGSGVCNACLNRSVAAIKGATTRRNRRPATRVAH